MRHIGAAKTGLISSTSTLWGIIGAILLIGESLTQKVIIGGVLMIIGIIGFTIDTDKK
jgi:drug/metabolite transporter (DMT)-like permease